MTGRKSKAKGPRVGKSAAKARQAREVGKKAGASRAQAAAPLLAPTAKKVSAPQKSSRTGKPQANYQPKTEPPATPVNAEPVAAPAAAVDVMTMAQPWMSIGWRMTAAGLAFQANMARAAFSMPPAAAAMRQGAEAMNAWLALMQGRAPKGRKG